MKIATYADYLPKLYEEFPDINKKSLRDAVRHGLGIMSFLTCKGMDTYLYNNMENLYYYFGQITRTEKKRYEAYHKKIRRKLRLMYSLKKTEYSGYMYFSLTEQDYERHLNNEPIPLVYLYKVEAELKVHRGGRYFRVAMDNPRRWYIMKENYETSSAEYIC